MSLCLGCVLYMKYLLKYFLPTINSGETGTIVLFVYISALMIIMTPIIWITSKAANGNAFVKKDDFNRNVIKASSDWGGGELLPQRARWMWALSAVGGCVGCKIYKVHFIEFLFHECAELDNVSGSFEAPVTPRRSDTAAETMTTQSRNQKTSSPSVLSCWMCERLKLCFSFPWAGDFMKKCLKRIQGELDSLLVLCGDSIRYVFSFCQRFIWFVKQSDGNRADAADCEL